MIKVILAGAVLLALATSPGISEEKQQSRSVETFHTFSNDGAWCWFQDPRAVYVEGRYKRTYAQWMTHDGKLQIGFFDHDTKTIGIHTLKEKWDADDHNVGSFLVLPDRRLMVFYARHSKVGLFCRTASHPEDIGQWESEVTVSDAPRITYSHPVYLSEENKFYVFWRGPSWKPTFSTSTDGKKWSKPQILIEDSGRESVNIRPYIKIVSDGKASIHFAFTDGHPRNEPTNSVYYLKYADNRLFSANGHEVGHIDNLPIQHGQSDVVYEGKATGVRGWVWDIALDDMGNPVIAYTLLPRETDHRYAYARWTGKRWLDVELTSGGKWFPQTPEGENEREPHYSGGMCLDHSNPSCVYLSRQINGVFEIEKWLSLDKGKTWMSQPITKNSDSLNVRPVVPRGYSGEKDHVLWMSGHYIHYTNYGTAIRMMVQ